MWHAAGPSRYNSWCGDTQICTLHLLLGGQSSQDEIPKFLDINEEITPLSAHSLTVGVTASVFAIVVPSLDLALNQILGII